MYAACTTTFCHGGALMPYGGNDWLALTQEPTLEPELPICDAHHHFWDLRPERLPYQRYLLHELVADVTCGHNVQSTVFIPTVSLDVILLVASSCGYYRGQIEQHAAQ